MGMKILALPAIVALWACASEPLPYRVEGDAIARPLAAGAADPVAGRRIFTDRDSGHCVLCHQVEGLDAPFQGDLGPALDDVGARFSRGQIRLRIVDASRLNPDTIMPPYYRTSCLDQVAEQYRDQPVLSAMEVEHLVAWLATLDAEHADARP
jgi:sulfur-oxidizing protein SoxX